MRFRIFGLGITAALLATACNTGNGGGGIAPDRNRTTASLRQFASCDELETQLKSSLSEELRTQLLMGGESYGRFGGGMDDVAMESDGAEPSASDSSGGSNDVRQEGVDFSGTNNQEEGVDEADFVKTDGYHIYTLNGNRLEIFSVPEFGDLAYVSTTRIEGRPSQMLQAGDALVVYSQVYVWSLPEGHPLRERVGDYYENEGRYWYWRTSTVTKVTVIDIEERAQPRVARELYIEGYYQTARKVDSSVRMVSYAWMDVPGLRTWPELPDNYWELDHDDSRREEVYAEAVNATMVENDRIISETDLSVFVPQVYERSGNTLVEHTFTNDGCAGFSIAEDGYGRGFTSILTLDLFSSTFSFEADHILTNTSHVYASADTMIIAESSFDWWWFWNNDDSEEATNLHRFDIGEGATTVYTGSGRVDGLILNQFSLSEYEGYVRVATTTGRWNRWWEEEPEPPSNNVFVLAGETGLDVVGSIGGIAVGERIWSSRFVEDEGFLVTFRNIDPLWTIDLSDPTQPTIKGELEVPGVSTYIHPIDGAHLLTIGYGGDQEGLDWKTQISLFDVTNFESPQVAAQLSMAPETDGDGWTYAWSEANYEHKAFQYWGPKKMLAIPLSTYRYNYDGEYYGYEYVSQLQLVSVDIESGLATYGSIDHSDFFNSDRDRYWSWRDVRRSIFMGDFIYAISDRGITAHRLASLSDGASPAPTASYQLPGANNDVYWEEW